jgi:hypothetical protein
MALIMENWKKFTDEAQKVLPCGEQNELKLFLFENNSPTPTSEILLDSLIEDYENEFINEEQIFDQWNQSLDYEYNELLKEGFLDALKSPLKTAAAIKAKALAKSKILKYVAKAFGGIIQIVKGLLGLVKKAERGMLDATHKKGGVDQKTIVKIYTQITSKIGAGIKKVFGWVGSILKGIMKVYSHPLVKVCVLVACVCVVMLSLAGSGLFVGALAFAPAFATRKLGIKGAKAFWKGIPNAPLAVAPKQRPDLGPISAMGAGQLTKEELLNEDMAGAEVFGQMMATILEAVPEGIEDVQEVEDLITAGLGVESSTWVTSANATLNDQLDAVEMLQNAMAGQDNELEMFMTLSESADSNIRDILENAKAVAEAACLEDQTICEASNELASKFKILYETDIDSEFNDFIKEGINSEGVPHSWQEFEGASTSQTTRTVARNPFEDPEASAGYDPGGERTDFQRTVDQGGASGDVKKMSRLQQRIRGRE